MTVSPATSTATLSRIDVRPMPRSEPPYDDELALADETVRSCQYSLQAGAVQGSLALAFALPGGLSAVPATPVPRPSTVTFSEPKTATDDDHDTEDTSPKRVATPRAQLPDPRRFAGRLTQAVVEVVAGGRPASQLARWTTQEVYDDVRSRLTAVARAGAPGVRRIVAGTVRSVHVRETGDGIAEVCAIVQRSGRAVAVALRLEGLDGRWMCTQLTFV